MSHPPETLFHVVAFYTGTNITSVARYTSEEMANKAIMKSQIAGNHAIIVDKGLTEHYTKVLMGQIRAQNGIPSREVKPKAVKETSKTNQSLLSVPTSTPGITKEVKVVSRKESNDFGDFLINRVKVSR